jgi:lambda family phage portal protein
MSLVARILSRMTGKPAKASGVRASYDAAQTTSENENHWANTDNYSANAAMDSGTRATLRDRSRYEADNNSYFRGLIETRACDLIGTGPRLQLSIPGDTDRSKAKQIERAYSRWARSVDFAEKLRILEKSGIRDGEGFAILTSNPRIPDRGLTAVTLDLRIYEAEQCSDPWDYGFDPLYTDGVRHDEQGNVTEYTFLKTHPGGVSLFKNWETQVIPGNAVLHWYRPYRPGQHRGVPELQAALPLFAQLRRYTLATLTAAETAAMLAGIMKSSGPIGDDAPTDESTFDKIPLSRGTLLTLPPGFDASQFKPEQPTGTYKDFKGELLNEIGRTIGVPFNVIAGNSSGYNYSSGRLDHQIYYRAIEVDRSRLRSAILDPVFRAWVQEAALANEIPAALPAWADWSWEWFFDGFTSIDPLKEANAERVSLGNGTMTLSEIYAAKGMDWEDSMRQRARENDLAHELGLTLAELAPTIPDEGEQVVPGVKAKRKQMPIQAEFDESKIKRDEDGKFGDGGAGGAASDAAKTPPSETSKKSSSESRKAAKEHSSKAKEAKSNGDNDVAKEHKKAERGYKKKADTQDAIDKANEEHGKKNCRD